MITIEVKDEATLQAVLRAIRREQGGGGLPEITIRWCGDTAPAASAVADVSPHSR